jgi:hypothetical protein
VTQRYYAFVPNNADGTLALNSSVEKVVGRREPRRAPGNQSVHCGIGVIGPEHDFDPAPFSFGTKAVMLPGCLYRGNSERKAIQLELDVRRFA